MTEVKLEIKNEVQSENTENSCQLQEVKKEKIKSESSDLIAFNTNQNNQPETNSNRIIKRVSVKNGIQIERVKSDASLEFEEVSPLSSPISSEFSISSIESFEDEVENIIVCVGNELAYQNNQGAVRDNEDTKFTSNVKQSESFKESRRHGDGKYERRNSRSRTNNRVRDRSRDDNRSRYKYSLDRDRSRYSSSRYRRSRSWDRSRSRYTSKRSRRSRSWDRSRRQRDSRSPLFRTRRGRRRTRSRSRSRSRSYGSTKLAFDKRSPLLKKRRLSPVTPPKPIWKVLSDSVRNCIGVKPPSPKPPPLPASPPPSKPPPPAENIPLPEPSVPVNSVTNAGLFSHIWVSHENHLPPNFYPFQNPAMPSVSVNNLPLVPGLENLPVHVTVTGEQILHDMDGRPIPVGPNGRLLPLDMSGRLYPHIVFPYNNQAVPIYMSEDGVLRLPNGEPVPYGHADKLPVNIDGSVIHIGPDSRPLYPCPNIPRQNPLITPKLENPAIPGVDLNETHQQVQPNPPPPPEIVQKNSNSNMKQRFKQNKLPPAVIQIKTVSDLKLKETEGSPEVETKTDSRENLEIKSEEPAATEIRPEDQKSELPPKKTPVENCKVPRRKKPYEDVDLPKLVKKFSERVSKINIREIYQKKVHGTIKDGLKPVEMENNVNVSKTDKKSGAGVVSDANPEKVSVCVAGEKEPRTCEKNSSGPRLGNEISAEEALLEKVFKETIQEAISLFAEIDFRPPVFGRFLFSKSKTTVTTQSPPNESPLLKNQIRLPFLTSENIIPMPEKKRSAVYFRFARPKDDDKDGKGTGAAGNPSFAVQCDFTSKKIRSMNAKIEKLRRELFQCKNQNAELTELYKSVREENKKKTDELAKVMKKVEEKNKIIRDLSQK